MFLQNLLRFYKTQTKVNLVSMVIVGFVLVASWFWTGSTEKTDLEDVIMLNIPDIMVYDSKESLKELLAISARTPNTAMASKTFSLSTNGEDVKKYYADNLLKLGWKYSGYEAQIDNRDNEHDADIFFFDKGEYRFLLYFSPPLEVKKESKYFYKKPQYTIHFAPKRVLDKY